MWVYQETKTNAAALVPTLPEDTAGESLAEKEAMTPASKPLAELPPQKAPRRKPFQASRDCILLAAAYLFGTLMAGVLQALCDAEEMETLAYYLDCWRGVFAASSAAQAVGLFGAELAVVLGAAAVFLLLGLSAVGPLPIFLFAMLYGTGSGLLSAQLLNSLGAKQLVLFLLTASLPTALAAGALSIAFGDFQNYWIADRTGRTVQRLNELYSTNGQVGFVATERVDGKIILPEGIQLLKMKAS